MIDYKTINTTFWNARAAVHPQTEFYNLSAFMQGWSSLQPIELELLGDVKGKSILHLQCHFGQDSLSLARMGATVTGVDISDEAIRTAAQLNETLALDATFVCCDVYDTPTHVTQQFDIVYTSYGVLGWLPDMQQWASVVQKMLKPGGKLVLVEFHPVVWIFDNDFTKVEYPYFKRDAIIETETGTYADEEANINLQSVSWNHGLAEVIGALLHNGLQLSEFLEYDYAPYNCFSNTVEIQPGRYRIAPMEDKIPMTYAVVATKP